jgi:hypothetical protein
MFRPDRPLVAGPWLQETSGQQSCNRSAFLIMTMLPAQNTFMGIRNQCIKCIHMIWLLLVTNRHCSAARLCFTNTSACTSAAQCCDSSTEDPGGIGAGDSCGPVQSALEPSLTRPVSLSMRATLSLAAARTDREPGTAGRLEAAASVLMVTSCGRSLPETARCTGRPPPAAGTPRGRRVCCELHTVGSTTVKTGVCASASCLLSTLCPYKQRTSNLHSAPRKNASKILHSLVCVT